MTVFFFFFFDQNCPKRVFPVENRNIALVRASMVVTYYVKLFCMGTDRRICIVSSPSTPRDNNMKYSETEPDNSIQFKNSILKR